MMGMSKSEGEVRGEVYFLEERAWGARRPDRFSQKNGIRLAVVSPSAVRWLGTTLDGQTIQSRRMPILCIGVVGVRRSCENVASFSEIQPFPGTLRRRQHTL